MNSKSRILPHLNICYLQKKAYDFHRKKIESIKSSLRSPITRKISSLIQNHTILEKLNRKDSPNKMSTIKEEGQEIKMSRMKPLDKRKYFQQVKQNQRLNKRIETCASTINRKNIEIHKVRSEELKNRISKFKNDPSSHKSQLKSQRSLQILEKLRVKQKYRDSSNFYNQNSSSKVLSEVVQINQRSKSFISKQPQRSTPDSETEMRSSIIKKSSFDKLMSIRHAKNIQSHFESQNQKLKSDKNRSGLRQKYKSNIKQKVSTELSQQFWKSRCFTTQLEHY